MEETRGLYLTISFVGSFLCETVVSQGTVMRIQVRAVQILETAAAALYGRDRKSREREVAVYLPLRHETHILGIKGSTFCVGEIHT